MTYADSVRILSWIVSIYAIGDGLGLYMAKKLYGNLSARVTICLAIIFSVIASLLFALAGSYIDTTNENSASSVIRQLCTARVFQGICNGTIYLTQQAYIGQVLPKEKNNALQRSLGRAMVLGAPLAVLLSFVCSLANF